MKRFPSRTKTQLTNQRVFPAVGVMRVREWRASVIVPTEGLQNQASQSSQQRTTHTVETEKQNMEDS